MKTGQIPTIRSIGRDDYDRWRPLWEGYNAFYGRCGPTALDETITAATWQRFFDGGEPVHAIVAERDGDLLGLCHYVFHRSTSRLNAICYLHDLFTTPACRGRGIGRALIEEVVRRASEAGSSRVYWTTQTTNAPGRALYDKVAEYRGFLVYSREI